MPILSRSIVAPRRRRAGAVADLLRRLARAAATWQRRNRERAQLATLDDRALRDVGLSRADAWALANKPFWRP
jgi:uncharacterized protein YjiS (DUF1127 family)